MELQIQSDLNYEQIEISVFNVTGQNILNSKNKTELDIRHLPEGAYFIEINLDGIINMESIMKIE